MAPITTASNEETHAALLDTLDMHKIHKPFRNPAWKPPQRRNKNLKQILSEAQRAPQPSSIGDATPSLNPNPAQASQDLSRLVVEKNAKQVNGGGAGTTVPSVTYTSIAAAPSLKPKKKYCDITGLPAKYKDPKTGLFYYNAEVYAVVKGLTTGQVQEYLAARGANTVLK
jgi:INO80 complex subunit C